MITKANMEELPKIVAVDFDGTLVEDKFPEIGKPFQEMFNICITLQKCGIKLILWTSRDNDTPARNLDAAVEFCKSMGLEFDAVNQNIPETIAMFHNDTRKVYADVYIDDKSIPCSQSPVFWAQKLGLSWLRPTGFTHES